MRRIADVGAAVIGTGFIGTVHVEQLRRIGVQVRGVLGSTPERGDGRAAGARRRARLPVARGAARRPVRRGRPRHLAEPSPRPPGPPDPGRRPPRRLREAAGHDAGRIRRARRPRRGQRPGQRRQLQHPLLSAPPARPRARRRRRARRRPPRDRPLLPGLAAPRDRLELAPRTRQGRLAAGGRRHRLALARPGDLPHRPADHGGHGGPRHLHPRARPAARPGRDILHANGRADTVGREMATEDVAPILLRFANGARGSVAVSQISAGRKNSLQWEIDGSTASAAWDSETPDHLWLGHRERPNELLLRDPALMGPAGRAAAALPGGHVEGFADTFGALFRAIYARCRCRPARRTAAVRHLRRRPRRDAGRRRPSPRARGWAAGSMWPASPPP